MTETWKTKNLSYLTWGSGALLVALTAGTIGSVWLYPYDYNFLFYKNLALQEKINQSKSDNDDIRNRIRDAKYSAEEIYWMRRWQYFFDKENKLAPQELRELYYIEVQEDFKQALVKRMPVIDFSAPDDKECSFCTRLREAYQRSDEKNDIPYYFD